MSVWTIVVAAGRGTRFGRAKQFETLRGRRVLDWSLSAASSVSDGVVVVLPADGVADDAVDLPAGVLVATGGPSRSASVRNGLALVPGDADVVVVHDAARPLASVALFSAVIDAVRAGADGALPAVAVTDTIRHVGGGTVDRSELLAVQTPQAFAAAALRRVHATDAEATDDAGLVEAAGGRVVIVVGEAANQKLTNPADLAVAAALAPDPGGAAATDAHTETEHDDTGGGPMDLRVGQGFDIHAFSDDPARPLVLGGVVFPGERGLAGHSDADAICHACTDAVLGAAGLGDIGLMFPDTDPTFAGADSVVLLTEAVARVRAAGWQAANIDCTVVCEAPKLAPRRLEIEARLTAVVGAPVTVKGKRAEGLGSIGRREGVACWAVALLIRPPALRRPVTTSSPS